MSTPVASTQRSKWMDRSLRQSQASSTWAQLYLSLSKMLSRAAQTTAALTRLKPVWKNRSISVSSKIPLLCFLVIWACAKSSSQKWDSSSWKCERSIKLLIPLSSAWYWLLKFVYRKIVADVVFFLICLLPFGSSISWTRLRTKCSALYLLVSGPNIWFKAFRN